jgi:hypothetical protein
MTQQTQAQPEQMVLVPQSWFGDIMKVAAPIAGTVAGTYLGNAQAGQAIGNAAGGVLGTLSAAPQLPAGQSAAAQQEQMVLVPQSWFGDIMKVAAPIAGTVAGTYFGNPQAGQAIGSAAGGVLGTLSAAPQLPAGQSAAAQQEQMVLVPQSWFGDIMKVAAPIAGTVAGTYFGNPQAGQAIGSAAGGVLGTLSAAPVYGG